METGLAVIEPQIEPSFHMVAVNGTEMQAATTNIRSWLTGKLQSIESDIAEFTEAHDSAVRHKWKAGTFKGMIVRKKQELQYYSKMMAALEAGFTIVPNMDVSVFAIRVDKSKPNWFSEGSSPHGSRNASPSIPQADEQRLEIGEGRYVSPEMDVDTYTSRATDGDKTITTVQHHARGFEDIEFPLAVAHPVVMDATAAAMALKVFDRIGIVPVGMRKRRGDPIVLGQITRKIGYSIKICSFLIAWHLDVRTL